MNQSIKDLQQSITVYSENIRTEIDNQIDQSLGSLFTKDDAHKIIAMYVHRIQIAIDDAFANSANIIQIEIDQAISENASIADYKQSLASAFSELKEYHGFIIAKKDRLLNAFKAKAERVLEDSKDDNDIVTIENEEFILTNSNRIELDSYDASLNVGTLSTFLDDGFDDVDLDQITEISIEQQMPEVYQLMKEKEVADRES